MCVRGLLLIAPFVVVSGSMTTSLRADPLAPTDAATHVGEVATVCGLIASTKYAPEAMGAPTFLDFGSPYPKAVFTALILGGDRAKFRAPEKTLGGKEVCVTGQIRLYAGTPQVILTQPEQLREQATAQAGP
jgi:hypothetical protein